jgi:hypothetical protein
MILYIPFLSNTIKRCNYYLLGPKHNSDIKGNASKIFLINKHT